MLAASALLAAFAPRAAAELTPGTPIAVAPGVPDQGRAWELVTPPDPVSSITNIRAIAGDGGRIAYMSLGPLPGAENGAPYPSANVAEREAGAWVNRPVATPHPEQGGFPGAGTVTHYWGPEIFTPDLTRWYGVRNLGDPLGPPTDVHLFGWPIQGPYAELADLGSGGAIVGASTDVERIFVTSEDHLLPADAARTSGASIYEVRGDSLSLVDVDNTGSLISSCGATVALKNLIGAGDYRPLSQAVSADGERIFFTARPGCAGSRRVFLREGASTTTEISRSRCDRPDCGPQADASFIGATPDGAHAFLVTAQQLTNADTNSHTDLYRYDAANHALTLISSVPGGPEIAPSEGPQEASVEPAVVSADGSRVYFVARKWDGTEAVGREDFYVASDGDVRLIPSFGNEERIDFRGRFLQISADGRYAVYASRAPLVAGDADESIDIYRFDATDASLVRISAGSQGGNRPINAEILPSYFTETVSSSPYRVITADGTRIFFSTAEPLVGADRNDAQDVYEWADGELGLVSAGSGDWGSEFIGTTADGRTAFFQTPGTLIPRDRDGGEVDIYAAPIGGGFPEPAARQETECIGAACRSISPNRPERTPPTSVERDDGLALRALGAKALRDVAHSGRLRLLLEAPVAGRLTVLARARIGAASRTIARTGVDIQASDPISLTLRLSEQARRALRRGRDLHVSLSLRLDARSLHRSLRFTLKGARR